MSHCGNSKKTLNISFCIATKLQFRCSSIIADFSNAEWLKYHRSYLYCDVPQLILDHDRTVLVPVDCKGILKMSSTSLEPYLWRQHSSVNSSPRTMSMSSCEPLAGAALQEAASGEPGSSRHNDKLIGSRPSVPCFCNELLLSNSRAPAGAGGRAGRRQEQSSCIHHNMNIMDV
jgi:hypothetical protein